MPRRRPIDTPAGDGLQDRVVRALNQIRPLAIGDGGDIELVAIDEDGTVRVRLLGACVGCPSSIVTLTQGVERTIKEQVPEIRRVVCA